jgi:hypothetical protein
MGEKSEGFEVYSLQITNLSSSIFPFLCEDQELGVVDGFVS